MAFRRNTDVGWAGGRGRFECLVVRHRAAVPYFTRRDSGLLMSMGMYHAASASRSRSRSPDDGGGRGVVTEERGCGLQVKGSVVPTFECLQPSGIKV